jgi:hypothetical protein
MPCEIPVVLVVLVVFVVEVVEPPPPPPPQPIITTAKTINTKLIQFFKVILPPQAYSDTTLTTGSSVHYVRLTRSEANASGNNSDSVTVRRSSVPA